MLTTSHINPARTEFGERFTQREPDSITVEEGDLLYALVRMRKPRVAIETGTGHAIATKRIGQALRANGEGFLVSCDTDPEYVQAALENVRHLPVDVRCTPGMKVLETLDRHKAQFIFIDAGDATNRLQEVATIVEENLLDLDGLLVIHDAENKKYKCIPEYVKKQGWPGLIFDSLAGMAVFKRP